MTANNDSADLEALFDSIASDYAPAPPAPVSPPPAAAIAAAVPGGMDDSDELQALFDSVAAQAQVRAEPPPAAGEEGWSHQEAVFNRIGLMARTLHDTLGELGYDKLIEQAVSALPDAKDRLAYVANLTEQAACRVLNATDIAVPQVDGLASASRSLGQRWDRVFANQLSTEEFKQLAQETRVFLNQDLPGKTQAVHAQLTEIVMAQDFQDLTGQVIKKIVTTQLMRSGATPLDRSPR